MKKSLNNRNNSLPQGILRRNRPGIVLLVTLVLLVVLSTLGYTLSTRVSAQRYRNQYIIDYSIARYGCDSAVKYALVALEGLEAQLISRPNEPDFSDLFYLTEQEYQELLEQWGLGFQDQMLISDVDKTGNIADFNSDEIWTGDPNVLGSLTISGPYGPAWPFVTEPVEFDIGSAKVRIEIEDENAKYPLGWVLLDDLKIIREVQAGFQTFCEMTGLNAEQIDSLRSELEAVGQIKPFALDFKLTTRTVKTTVQPRTGRGKSTSTSFRVQLRRKAVSASQQLSEQTTHFAKFFHSSLIDTESLARPTIISTDRKESALKYLGLWGSMKVNVNTAPRHVLEAAFTFAGDQVQIAEEIIQRRRIEPFTDIQDLRTSLFRYSDSIGKCEKYITTSSRFFTIKVTAVSGAAKASTVIAITKDGKIVKRIAVING